MFRPFKLMQDRAPILALSVFLQLVSLAVFTNWGVAVSVAADSAPVKLDPVVETKVKKLLESEDFRGLESYINTNNIAALKAQPFLWAMIYSKTQRTNEAVQVLIQAYPKFSKDPKTFIETGRAWLDDPVMEKSFLAEMKRLHGVSVPDDSDIEDKLTGILQSKQYTDWLTQLNSILPELRKHPNAAYEAITMACIRLGINPPHPEGRPVAEPQRAQAKMYALELFSFLGKVEPTWFVSNTNTLVQAKLRIQAGQYREGMKLLEEVKKDLAFSKIRDGVIRLHTAECHKGLGDLAAAKKELEYLQAHQEEAAIKPYMAHVKIILQQINEIEQARKDWEQKQKRALPLDGLF